MGWYGPWEAGLKKGSGACQPRSGPGSEVPTTTLNLTHLGTGPAQEVLRLGTGGSRGSPGPLQTPGTPETPLDMVYTPLGQTR